MSVLAGAVNATVLRADPAGLFQSSPQLLPGAVMPYAKIVSRHSQSRADLLGRFASQIEPSNQFRVIRLERGDQRFDTTTSDAFLLRIRRGIQFAFQSRQRGLVHRAAAIEVNDRAAQDAVKPGQGLGFLGWLLDRRHGFDQTILHHIFGELRIADAAARERHEGFQVRQQRFFDELHAKDFSRAGPNRKAMTGATQNSL